MMPTFRRGFQRGGDPAVASVPRALVPSRLRAAVRVLVFALAGWLTMAGPARSEDIDFAPIVGRIHAVASAAVGAYEPVRGMDLADIVSGLYFDVFEGAGMESAVGAVDQARKLALEARFGNVIGLASRGAPHADVAAAWGDLDDLLKQTAGEQRESTAGTAATFSQSFYILLRAGAEALLVAGALVAYLHRLGAVDRLRPLWMGVASALAASVAAAWLMGPAASSSSRTQDAVGGLITLIAAAVLAYVSHWLFVTRDGARGMAHAESPAVLSVSDGHAILLGTTAFLAVFREGLEAALSYRAQIAAAQGTEPAILAGMIAGALSLAAIGAASRRVVVRLPVGGFFVAMTVLLYGLALAYVGNGVVGLQEARWIASTPVPGVPTVPWLGVFPTTQSLAAQGVLLMLLLGVLVWTVRRRTVLRARG